MLTVLDEVERSALNGLQPQAAAVATAVKPVAKPAVRSTGRVEKVSFPNAVTTASLAKVLRAWLAKGGPDDDHHTLASLSRMSGVSTRKMRSILAEQYETTKEEIADRICAAIDRVDLFYALEFVTDGRANKQQKTSCV